jgi:hypothetical protein
MLKQLIQKRNEQLQQIDEFMQNANISTSQCAQDLKAIASSIKSSLVSFAPSLISVFESILARSKLVNQLYLVKLLTYWPIMRNELDIPLANVQLDANFHATDLSLHMVPRGQILLCIKKRKENDDRLFDLFELCKPAED